MYFYLYFHYEKDKVYVKEHLNSPQTAEILPPPSFEIPGSAPGVIYIFSEDATFGDGLRAKRRVIIHTCHWEKVVN